MEDIPPWPLIVERIDRNLSVLDDIGIIGLLIVLERKEEESCMRCRNRTDLPLAGILHDFCLANGVDLDTTEFWPSFTMYTCAQQLMMGKGPRQLIHPDQTPNEVGLVNGDKIVVAFHGVANPIRSDLSRIHLVIQQDTIAGMGKRMGSIVNAWVDPDRPIRTLLRNYAISRGTWNAVGFMLTRFHMRSSIQELHDEWIELSTIPEADERANMSWQEITDMRKTPNELELRYGDKIFASFDPIYRLRGPTYESF
jgi:hypothetical protein